MTVFPGTILDTPEKEAEVIAVHGVEHVAVCVRCNSKFYKAKVSEVCWGCWYVTTMDSITATYQDVFDAIKKETGLDVYMDQTGGMCMAINVKYDDHFWFWLTNVDDTLSFERETEDGWTLGVYFTDSDDSMPLPLFEGEDYISDPVKNPETAVKLVKQAIQAIRDLAGKELPHA